MVAITLGQVGLDIPILVDRAALMGQFLAVAVTQGFGDPGTAVGDPQQPGAQFEPALLQVIQ